MGTDTEATPVATLDADGYALIAACFSVYNEMGSGFLEEVYHECLARELLLRRIPYESQVRIPLTYRGEQLTKYYTADFVIGGRIVVEIKAVKTLLPEHEAQVLNYLKATGQKTGYLVNFGAYPKLDWRRRVR